MRGKLLKGSLVVGGALVVSTLGIFASDGLRNIDRDLTALTGVGGGICPEGMVLMRREGNALCIDMYEASPSSNCPHASPRNTIETETNINNRDCYAASVPDVLPWRFVSLPQAQRLCAGAGKRLPSSEEWYHIALGTPVEECVTDGNTPSRAGQSSCVSSVGVHDTVGNVWEWTNENVIGNEFGGRVLPETGYVDSVDVIGVAITTSEDSSELYGEDYFWSETDGVFGMIRGGFYNSQEDAGLYTINASVQTSFASQGVGFRCVMDV